ncbi:hypothetical protein KQI68_08135 [Peptoniphilus sp. MSJ-1]|uniref:Uncharacterized protein n=1 Tax=Peptoniphilus ovalis TaxID=2841503 RepID=A0ABS6FHZ7_9FIRM|nr:stalk domain-containing protein [Peptoniphilus ovalis]MBU5669802.1 hypothetical protein [Peptoniphilus ovalis]
MKNNFKKVFVSLIFLAILIPIHAFANGEIKIWINGDYVKSDVAPFIENDRTLVPVRVISENLGYQVDWNGETKEVNIIRPDSENPEVLHFLGMTIGDSNIYTFDMKVLAENDIDTYFQVLTNSVKTPIDAAPKIVNERTFVPIRVIAENFGQKVDWDAENKTVIIGDGYNFNASKTAINTNLNNAGDYQVTNNVTPVTTNLVSNPKGTNNLNTYDIPATGSYVGNANSKKFHRSNCKSASKTSPKNRVNFGSRNEAVNAGYVPCKICNP